MKMNKKIKSAVILKFSILLLFLCSCGSLEQWSQGLQAISDGLSGTSNYYTPSTHYPKNASTNTGNAKEWHNCSQCNGSGHCKYCGGSGHDDYTKNKKCGVCRGTGKCAGCNGKGGWKI